MVVKDDAQSLSEVPSITSFSIKDQVTQPFNTSFWRVSTLRTEECVVNTPYRHESTCKHLSIFVALQPAHPPVRKPWKSPPEEMGFLAELFRCFTGEGKWPFGLLKYPESSTLGAAALKAKMFRNNQEKLFRSLQCFHFVTQKRCVGLKECPCPLRYPVRCYTLHKVTPEHPAAHWHCADRTINGTARDLSVSPALLRLCCLRTPACEIRVAMVPFNHITDTLIIKHIWNGQGTTGGRREDAFHHHAIATSEQQIKKRQPSNHRPRLLKPLWKSAESGVTLSCYC